MQALRVHAFDQPLQLGTLPVPQAPTDPAFYLQHCVKACEGGVERSHILPFAADGALLMEVFTHDGIGTMVVDEKLESTALTLDQMKRNLLTYLQGSEI